VNIYLFIAFVTVFLMFLVAMHYGHTVENMLRRLEEKNKELQSKVDAWILWAEENDKEGETKPPGSV
jgi:hypothetical protein